MVSASEVLSESYRELNKAEAQLGVEATRLDPEVLNILDSFVEPSGQTIFPDLHIYGIPVGRIVQYFYNELDDSLEKRKLRRLARLAPEAVKDETSGPGT